MKSQHDLNAFCERCGKQKIPHTIKEAQNCTNVMAMDA